MGWSRHVSISPNKPVEHYVKSIMYTFLQIWFKYKYKKNIAKGTKTNVVGGFDIIYVKNDKEC